MKPEFGFVKARYRGLLRSGGQRAVASDCCGRSRERGLCDVCREL